MSVQPLMQFPALMGILNVTPDSFSDGGKFFAEQNLSAPKGIDIEKVVAAAKILVARGGKFLDVGGESTRPGAAPVSDAEELRRTIPVVRRLVAIFDVPVSIDTTKAMVAAAAIEAGAMMVNDISGATFDPRMIEIVAKSDALVCLGHVCGTPKTLHTIREQVDMVRDVSEFLAERRDALLAAGVARDRIFLDPGIGFGKTSEQNVALLENIPTLKRLECRLVVGVSRKRFLGGKTLAEKDHLTTLWTEKLFRAGVDVVRVHQIRYDKINR